MILPNLPSGWRGVLGRAVFRAVPARLVLRSQGSGTDWFQSLRKHAVARMQVPEGFSLTHARSLPAVIDAVRLIAWRVACLPLRVYTPGSSEPVVATDPEARVLTERWSAHTTAKAGIAQFTRHVLLHGYAGAVVVREGRRVAAIQTVNPHGLSRTLVSGERRYHYTAATGGRIPIPRDDLFFLAFEEPDDGVTDESPLASAWPAIRSAVAATIFSGWYYDRGAEASSVWLAPEGTTKDALKKAMLAVWRMEDRMRSAGRRSLAMPTGWQHVQTGANIQDASASEERTFGVQEVARIYGIPPTLLQEMSRGNYSNYSQQRQAMGEVLGQWAIRIADEFSNIMWPDGQRTCRFDLSHAVKDPLQERMRAYRSGIEGGVLTPNECRELEDREPSTDEGADVCRRNDAPVIMVGEAGARALYSGHETNRQNGDGPGGDQPAHATGAPVGAPFDR